MGQNTIHTTDFASAAHRIAIHTLSLPRYCIPTRSLEALSCALTTSDDVSKIPGAAKMGQPIQAQVYNIVDDGETKQEDLVKVIAEVVGVKSGFHGSIISGFAKYVPPSSSNHGVLMRRGQNEHTRCTRRRQRESETPFRSLFCDTRLMNRSVQHLEGWSSLLGSCDPPLSNTVPISPYIVSFLIPLT